MNVSSLDRKLLRDLWRLRWQVAAIALLIACGVSVAVMAFSAQRVLVRAQEDFYAEAAFADVFAQARRAPMSLMPSLFRVEGVTAVDVRILEAGLMDVPGLSRPAVARLISLPDDPDRALNRIRVVRGRMPEPMSTDEVVALAAFLDASGVRLGDRVTAVIAGRAFTFRVVGAALSAEHVYVPAPESLMPDDAHQAVIWAPRRAVERAAGMSGAFNTVALTLGPNASAPAVLAEFDRILAPYGGRAAYARSDQPSDKFLSAELRELATSATVLPPVFLLVAASLVHLVITRLVETEREQIGLLKAFGYSNAATVAPYLKLAALIAAAGAIGGGLLGTGLAVAIVEQYRQYFRFPVFEPQFHLGAFVTASLVAIVAALSGASGAARRAARLSPAVAMQAPRPTAYRAGLLEGLPSAVVDQATRMIARSVARFPLRSCVTTAGMAASLSLLVGTQFLFDSLDAVIDRTYYRAQSWSEAVGFAEPVSRSALANALRLPGVYAAEGVRSASARLQANGRQEMIQVLGLEPDSQFSRPLDGQDRRVPFKGGGLVLGEALAERLAVAPGDVVRVLILDGRGAAADLRVTGLSRDFSGLTAYISRRELNRLMAEGDLIDGAQLLVADDRRLAFYRAVERIPAIVGASSREDTVAGWRQAMAAAFQVTISFFVGFAAAIAFGVAYNACRISLSERARDLATLQVLGFGHRECAYILAGETAVLALLAIPVGLLGGLALAHGLVEAYSRDEVRLPAVIGARSYGVALLAYIAAVGAAAALVVRRVWKLDMVAVLKTRE